MGAFRSIIGAVPCRGLAYGCALAGSLALGGCGGVELNGKLFDYAGLSGSGEAQDIRMTERPPLVLPPDRKSLPVPGQSPAVAAARPDWPTDTDVQNKQIVEAKKAEDQKQEAAEDPGNPYAGKPTLLDSVLGRNRNKGDDLVDVPEPDPSDKTPQDRAREQSAVASAGGPKPLTPSGVDDTPTPPAQDPFHPAAPDSYKQMSAPPGNRADY